MARRKTGAFNKVLEIIGLVDDEDPRDSYDDGYAGDSYGRQTYTPQQRSRVDDNYRRTAERDDVRRDSRNTRYDSQRYSDRYSEQPKRRNTLIERVDDDRDYRSSNNYRSRERDRDRYNQGDYQSNYQPRKASSGNQRSSGRFGDLDEQPRNTSRFAEQNVPGSRFDQEPAMPVVRESRAAQKQRTVMFALHSLEDCCEVIDNLISNNTVVLTLDELDVKLMQRAVDTLSGAVFALHATIRKASDKTYLIAPSSVEVNESYDLERRF